MKYTKDERINIGRQVYTHEITHSEAMNKYGIVSSCVDTYVRLYKIENGIPVFSHPPVHQSVPSEQNVKSAAVPDMEAYMAMTKEELINELIKAKANELRAKKGYEVKGAGANKEFISLNSRNTKS
jgi:transposase